MFSLASYFFFEYSTRVNIYQCAYVFAGQERTGFFMAQDLDQLRGCFSLAQVKLTRTRKIGSWHAPRDSIEEILTGYAAEPTSMIAVRDNAL